MKPLSFRLSEKKEDGAERRREEREEIRSEGTCSCPITMRERREENTEQPNSR